MIGKNVANWIKDLRTADTLRKLKVAKYLLGTSEYYFEDKKVSVEDRIEIIESIEFLASHEAVEIRKCVGQLVGLMKTWSDSTPIILGKLIDDFDDQVQATAVWAIGNIGNNDRGLIEALLSKKAHSNREVRWRVPWALRELEANGDNVVSALIELTKDTDDTTIMYAFDALATSNAVINESLLLAVKHGLENNSSAACRVVAQVIGDWSTIRKDLENVFESSLPSGDLDAVIALCNNWPESINAPKIKHWLKENDGYWWTEKVLAGERV
jgi:HEAT repeat protein